MTLQSLTRSGACALLCSLALPAHAQDKILFNFEHPSDSGDWAPVKLPELSKEQAAPKVEVVPASPAGKCLKIVFDGGEWPAIGTARIPVKGNWKEFQTLKADLTTDRAGVAYFRVCQGK